ncbi:Nuclease P1 [Fulvia fulva]|nr:Nuclease P1 [Fulvia fulva]WPV21007.1 Nuclease P1 [Fulvia fulva]
MPDGADILESGDLYPTYYNSAIDTIELQIAKGGYWLAKWLDAIAANQDAKKKRMVHGGMTQSEDLTGSYLLPLAPMSRAQMRREAVGYNCKH